MLILNFESKCKWKAAQVQLREFLVQLRPSFAFPLMGIWGLLGLPHWKIAQDISGPMFYKEFSLRFDTLRMDVNLEL